MVAWLHCFQAHRSTVPHGRIRRQKELWAKAWERRKSRGSTIQVLPPWRPKLFHMGLWGIFTIQPTMGFSMPWIMNWKCWVENVFNTVAAWLSSSATTCCVERPGPPWEACSLPYSSILEDGQTASHQLRERWEFKSGVCVTDMSLSTWHSPL